MMCKSIVNVQTLFILHSLWILRLQNISVKLGQEHIHHDVTPPLLLTALSERLGTTGVTQRHTTCGVWTVNSWLNNEQPVQELKWQRDKWKLEMISLERGHYPSWFAPLIDLFWLNVTVGTCCVFSLLPTTLQSLQINIIISRMRGSST